METKWPSKQYEKCQIKGVWVMGAVRVMAVAPRKEYLLLCCMCCTMFDTNICVFIFFAIFDIRKQGQNLRKPKSAFAGAQLSRDQFAWNRLQIVVIF